MSTDTLHRPPTTDAAGPGHGPMRRYDLAKELVVALIVVSLLTVGLAAVFSSPDDPSVTLADWATAAPKDFLATAAAELAGTSDSAQYGPPYTHTPGSAQKIGPVDLQALPGVRIPLHPATDFVIGPLTEWAAATPALRNALDTYRQATATQRSAWLDAYTASLDQATMGADGPHLSGDGYGPVSTMLADLYTMARTGALDGALVRTSQFYRSDYTKPLLFLSDGSYLASLAQQHHLLGDQWGMMNETGNYPGQAWLWLYTFWYQVPPFASSGNADALVWALMMLLTLGLVLLPFIPGLRDIPAHLPVHRWIWRRWYREQRVQPSPSAASEP